MKTLFILLLFGGHLHAQLKSPAPPGIAKEVFALTEVMYHDVVNPPAAARFYAYSILAGYEVLRNTDSSLPGFSNIIPGYPKQVTAQPVDLHKEFAALYAILETGRHIIPSGSLLEEKQLALVDYYRNSGVEPGVLESSIGFASAIAKTITDYSRSDGYFKLSTLTRYRPSSVEGSWSPTPPEYMSAVEPNWSTIRPFFMDSCSQFRPISFVKFDPGKSSGFYELVQEVYQVSNKLTEEQKLIANFWDCNPFAVQFQGHMSIGLKKISPGGHWMGITGIAAEKASLSFSQSILLHTLVALTLHDAFISCWDEKYRSNRIRPETAINKYLDPQWKPLLQTPPFPEYSSGHSVISTAAAEVLTYFLGDGFSFVDTTESYIGLPARTFVSFRDAAAEARISRLYGGIHFRDAIENGGEQGGRIGEFVLRKLGLRPF